MKALIAATILSAMTIAQETGVPALRVTPEQAFVNQLAEAFEVPVHEMRHNASLAFQLDLRHSHQVILPAGGAGLPAPVAYFIAEVSPTGVKPHTEGIYFFVMEGMGSFYIRLGSPRGIQFGSWSIGKQDGQNHQYVHLRGPDFWADFPFSQERPLETMRAPFFCNQGYRGHVVLTPGC